MPRARIRSRTVALAIACELIVGAVIWFSSTRSDAQPSAEPSAQVTTADGSAQPQPAARSTSPTAAGAPNAGSASPATAGSATPTAAGTPNADSASSAPAGSASPTTAGSAGQVTPHGVTAPAAPTDVDAAGCPKSKSHPPKSFLQALSNDLLPIGILIVVIALVLLRLPKVNLGHSKAFRRRRLLNWLPLGLTYTFLYFARYNIKSFQGVGISASEFGDVFAWGSGVYGLAFLLNGPLTDRWGGRATILIAAVGAGAANLWMGYMAATGNTFGLSVPTAFTVAYAVNMYFQSFGAVSIVKVNAAWFHLRERGTFGGIFGILISLGLYFAFDVIARIKESFPIQWIFLIPAMLLFVFFVLSFLFVRNEPADAGHPNFDLGDATQAEDAGASKLSWTQWLGQIGVVLKKLLTHPVLLTIALIELCSGFLRQAILQWGPDFGRGVGVGDTFVFHNWGMVSCVAGITGGMFAGAISDHVFQSRRSPVSSVLYAIMLSGAIGILVLLGMPSAIGWIVAFMSMAIIGVHGMLTATASADFAGKHNTGVAVGMIDGFVYLGSTIQSKFYGWTLPQPKIRVDGCLVPNPDVANIENWHVWPYAMIPVAVVGLLLTFRIWNAKPRQDAPPAH